MKPDPGPLAPPALIEWLLARWLRRGIADRTILGDLREEFAGRAREDRAAARRWYRRAAVDLLFTRLRHRLVAPRRPAHHLKRRKPSGDDVIQQLWREIRYACRTLRRAPAFTIVATVTLTLGIGANTAIFSVVNAVLIEPLPFEDGDALVGVFHTAPGLGYPQLGISPGIYVQYAEHNRVFEQMALFGSGTATVTGESGDPERVSRVQVTRSLFATLRVTPSRGRVFTVDEDRPGSAAVAIIGYGLWQRRFGGGDDVIGRTIRVDGVAREIVGVMPPEFTFPRDDAELWLPMQLDPTQATATTFTFASVARLRPDVTAALAEHEITPLLERVREVYGQQGNLVAFMDAGQLGPLIKPYKEEMVGDLRRPLWILMGTVVFVLLIACVNVANLLLVRTEGRRRELAVRAALGAQRSRLIGQFLAESAVVAALGGAGGLVLAAVGVPVLVRAAPESIPRLGEVGIDLAVLLFTVAVVAMTAALFGLAPAIRYTAPGLTASLREGGRGSTGGHRQLVRNALVGAQAGLALMLLVGSGLMVRSFWRIHNVDPGFRWEDVLTFRVTLPSSDYPTPTSIAAFHSRLLVSCP